MPKIMLVDDDENIGLFDALRPDLIFFDITMAGIDGWEVCRQINNRTPATSTPLSILSA